MSMNYKSLKFFQKPLLDCVFLTVGVLQTILCCIYFKCTLLLYLENLEIVLF